MEHKCVPRKDQRTDAVDDQTFTYNHQMDYPANHLVRS